MEAFKAELRGQSELALHGYLFDETGTTARAPEKQAKHAKTIQFRCVRANSKLSFKIAGLA